MKKEIARKEIIANSFNGKEAKAGFKNGTE